MDDKMQGHFNDLHRDVNLEDEGVLTSDLDPLALIVPDEELGKVFDKRLSDSRSYFRQVHDLYARREKNEMFYFGRQITDMEKNRLLKDYESRFMDNVLYEIEATIKPLAMSRLPDLIVTPGHEGEESKLLSENVSKAIDTELKSRQNRKVLGLATKHLPVYFTAVLKARWDNELDDYIFECIHPDMIDVDHTCPTNNADDMQWVSQIVPLTVQEVLMRFPKKEEEFIKELHKDGVQVGEDGLDWKALATTIKIREIWFTWYKKHNENEWEAIDGVLWKYHDCILDKMKNPNYDYEGEERYFEYDSANNKEEINSDTARMILQTGIMPENVKSEQVYHNFFTHPRKPYFFMGYDQWGEMPYDATSRIEQNIQNQKSLDKRGKQIEETLDNRGHNVFSKDSGLKPSDVEDLDMNDPDTDVIVDGNVNDVHKFIAPARPDPAEFKDLDDTRNRMYGISGSNAVRGQIQTDVATTNQIAREADFTRADDLVEDTINAASEWMAQYALQFIKLRYTEDHWRKILGVAGKAVFIKLNRNMIDDGMEVMMKASGTDKLKAQNNALEMAKMQMIDPINFYRDMGYPDYEERAAMLMDFSKDPMTYELKYIKNLSTSQEMMTALEQQPIDIQPQPPQPPPMGMPAPGGMPPPMPPGGAPQAPTPTDTSAIPQMNPVAPPAGSARVM